MVSYQCRTCREKKKCQYYALTEYLDEERCPKKTLADFLWDIAKINNKTEDAKRLPQQICGSCSRKLKNTYSFILQAQVANRKLFASLYIGKAGCSSAKDLPNKSNDCLLEAPIDIPMLQADIKKENLNIDDEAKQGEFDDYKKSADVVEENEDADAQSVKEESLDLEQKQRIVKSTSGDDCMAADPITTAEKHEENTDIPDNTSDQDTDKSEGASNASPPTKRRRGRSQAKTLEFAYCDDAGRYHCKKCDKTFAWKKDAERHYRIHTGIYPYECEKCGHLFQSKDKYDDHMEVHARGGQEKDQQISEDEMMDLGSKLQVELDANDTSDEQSEEEYEEIEPKRRRGKATSTKKPEFTFNNDDERYHCNRCNKDFAWKKDVERHLKSHYGIYPYECSKCGHRFQRKDKFSNHLKVHERQEAGVARRPRPEKKAELSFAEHLYSELRFRSLECKLCTEHIPNLATLRTHLQTHIEPHTINIEADSDVVKELFPNANGGLDHIKLQICKDIKEQRYGKYYAIINAYGYEMALSDSDTEPNTEDADKKYECELCQAKVARKHQLIQHIKAEHAQQKLPHKCNVCKLQFVSSPMYEFHSRTQCRNRDRKYQCLKCPGKFVWLQNLQGHKCSNRLNLYAPKKTEKGKQNLLQCNFCDKTFRYATDLKRHQEIHNLSSRSHICNICSQPFLKAENLRQHMRQAHDQFKRRILCCLCGETPKTLAKLRIHLQNHADGWTGIRYSEGLYFKAHWPQGCKGKEAEVEQSIVIDFAGQNLTPYYCAVDESGNEMDLYDSETDVELETNNPSSSVQPTINVYSCDLCGEAFFRRSRILQHQHSAHADSSETLPHACGRCDKQYVCLGLLEQHYKRECGNIYKRYDCKRCSARFVWEENLQQHMQRQHIDPEQQISRQLANKLQCDECHKVFVWPKDLTRHKRIHMPDDEKFECPYCDRKFYRKDHLQTHLKTHGASGNTAAATTTAAATKRELNRKVNAVEPHLCKPNGLKCVQCKICLSTHTKIADLREHLMEHRSDVSLSQNVAVSKTSLHFYPDEAPMPSELLIARMKADLTAGQLDRFYSITNELGHELSISGSDTDDTDSDSEPNETLDHAVSYSIQHPRRSTYNCDLCSVAFTRKYKLFAHQASDHSWDDAPYVCQHCQAHFLCDKLLQSHYRHQCKNLLKRYVCRKCPQRFMWKENLKMHLRTMHPDSEDVQKIFSLSTYDCDECSRSFQMQKDLTRHQVIHRTDTTVFPCLFCQRKFYRRSNLYLHIKRHGITSHELSAAAAHIAAFKGPNGKKEILCRVCNMEFKTISALRAHLRQETSAILRTHHNYTSQQNYSIMNELGFELDINDSETEGEENEDAPTKSYKCQICGLVCKRRYEMGQHQLSIHRHELITLKCDKCVFRTVSNDILEHHIRTLCGNIEKQYQCTQCSYKFMWPENLEVHIKLVHPPIPEEAPPLEGIAETTTVAKNDTSGQSIFVPPQVFQCDQCERRYNRKDRLVAHMKKSHTYNADNPSCSTYVNETKTSITGKKSPKEKSFLCAFCGRAVSSSSNLIVHMRRHTGEKPFQCEFCDKAFPRSSDLACHRRTHTGEKPHHCTVCGKSFSRSYKLQQHMRIHSGERPYQCTYCEKSFTQSNDLNLHVRRHTGERPYVCNVCGEGFIQGTALKHHRAAHRHFEGDPPQNQPNNVLQLSEGNSLIQL
ncbi:zinc finger protein Xfin-like [Eurosta solidaginis]|uniref:zinc finger protein Xfin-like n=1 Tax=Eurosta solidaginis TaxID=178769 RepID=UPI003530D327